MQRLFNDENYFVCTGRVTGSVKSPESLLAVFGLAVDKLYEVEDKPYPVPSRFKVEATNEVAEECLEKLTRDMRVRIVGSVEIAEEELKIGGEVKFREDGVTPVMDKIVTIHAKEVQVFDEDLDSDENYFACTGLVTGNVRTFESSLLAVFGLAVDKLYEVEDKPYPVSSRFKVEATNEVADKCVEMLSRDTETLTVGSLEIAEDELKIGGKVIFREDGVTPVMEKIITIHAEDVQVRNG